MDSDEEVGNAFGSEAPFSVGVEEELFLVDPVTGRQVNSSTAVLERLGPTEGTAERELHACQVELITDICRSAGEAVLTLDGLRRAVVADRRRPARLGDASLGERGRGRDHRQGSATSGSATCSATPSRRRSAGLHIHVGMPDAETAIRAFNGLRRHLPLLQALAANSPFRHGRDTGLASAREVTIRGWPRSGVPRAMRDFSDFCAAARLLARAADVPDYTWFWWKLRPHPRLGTVEVRALDAQASLKDTAALVALVHCLARYAAEADPEPDPPAEVLEEGSFRAARFGVKARLPDAEGRLRPVSELLDEVLTITRGYARELDCADQLDGLPALLERGGGAGAQRAAYEIAGMGGLLRELTQLTGAGVETGDSGSPAD